MTIRGVRVDSKNADNDLNDDDEDDMVKSSLCCLEGCLATTSVGFSFFVALPTGILLLVYSKKDNDVNFFIAGIVLIILPLFVLLVVIVLCFNKHRLKLDKLRFRKKTSQEMNSHENSVCAKY
ncbi:hypothetical protein LOTGIDRAFT_160269 [Lottia gigantea]|uniref:Uncharacterized protein n=1 Tax=Lottia gigantea TaxID=225164 RepID=V4ALT4_LOTGI|nr:hypothetical protein LOTGIDRAFT_160269 [Lottia gigantea]ESO95720.1 hypothetical protein LOTGIDRAFT_160269 [Lottia gigantea]